MSTIPRVSSAVPGEPAHFGSALAHQPVLAKRFGDLYGTFWGSDVLSARVKELCRMRNARITQCGFCRQVRFDKALQAGLDERAIADVTDDYPQSDQLSDAEKAALRFTDALIHDPELLDRAARDNLRRHFSAPQIAEIGMGVALFIALAKVLITLGLEPDEMGTTVLPTPARSAGGEALAQPVAHDGNPLDTALDHRRELADRFRWFVGASREQALLDPAVLDLIQNRIAAAHGPAAPAAAMDAARSAALVPFLDKIPFAHHSITDAEAEAVRAALGDAGLVAFAVNAALADAIIRLRQVMAAVELSAEPVDA